MPDPDYGRFVSRLPQDTEPRLSRALGDVFRDLVGEVKRLKDWLNQARPIYAIQDYSCPTNGTTDARAALIAADTAAGTTQSLYLGPGTYKIASNTTLSGNLVFAPGAVIKPDASVTVTLNGSITAGGWQIFDVTNSGAAIAGTAKVDMVNGLWFGMTAAGSGTSNTTQFNAAIAFTGTTTGRTLYVPKAGNYYSFNSQPANITLPINIVGDGFLSTGLLRNFAGSGGIGFLNIKAAGVNIRGIGIYGASGTSSGSAIALTSTSSEGYDGLLVEDVWISSDGVASDVWNVAVYIDGTAKTTGAVGCRTSLFRNVHVFGASVRSVELKSVVNFTWYGGGIYPAGGTGTESLNINGGVVDSQYVNIDVGNIGADINLSDCQDVYIKTTAIDDVINSGSALRCRIGCTSYTSCQSNWVESGISQIGNGNALKTMAADANDAISNTQAQCEYLQFNSSVALTATRDITVPLDGRRKWIVFNNTTGAQSLRFIGATGTGTIVANAKRAIVYSDGTNVVRITPDT